MSMWYLQNLNLSLNPKIFLDNHVCFLSLWVCFYCIISDICIHFKTIPVGHALWYLSLSLTSITEFGNHCPSTLLSMALFCSDSRLSSIPVQRCTTRSSFFCRWISWLNLLQGKGRKRGTSFFFHFPENTDDKENSEQTRTFLVFSL